MCIDHNSKWWPSTELVWYQLQQQIWGRTIYKYEQLPISTTHSNVLPCHNVFFPLHETLQFLKLGSRNLLKFPQKIFGHPIIHMQTYTVLLILVTFYSAAVSAGLQGILNVAKYIADIHQALPNSCLFIINSEGEMQGEKRFIFFLARIVCFCQKCAQILCHQFTGKYIFEKYRILINHGNIIGFRFDKVLQLC
jgi:hypothetical protein